MTHLPKAIPELDGGLFLPRQLADLLEAMLIEHEQLLRQQPDADQQLTVLAQSRVLLRFTGPRLAVPPARDQLGLEDPVREAMSRNLLRIR